MILLIEDYCKNKAISSTPSEKQKNSQAKKCKREENVKGKDKSKHKPSSPPKNITQKESELGSSGCSAKDTLEDEEGTDVGEFSSNLEGYP